MTKLDIMKDYGKSTFLSGDLLHAQLQRDGIEELILTIAGVRKDNNKNPWILSFEEDDSELRLNKSNARILVGTHGDDDDNWKGKRVGLSVYWTDFTGDDGKRVEAWAIKLRPIPENTYAKATGVEQPTVIAASEPDRRDFGQTLDDAIPF